ncbi:MAG TPA: RtcB family protein, partial [Nevskiaceae bacterium]|nr:RtcB family protein [Nevskiaceae bacterium]
MTIQKEIATGSVPVKIWTTDVDEASVKQLSNIAQLPFVHHHVAAMPDVHLGIGATVGSVIATRHAIVPAAVGVDIGCGMAAVRTTLTAEDIGNKQLDNVFRQISRDVPVGRDQHREDRALVEDAAAFKPGLAKILAKHPKIASKKGGSDWVCQLGSLGGGNHFIEVCLDEEGRVWVMLHSGSRGIGNKIGTYFIERAREKALAMNRALPDLDLAWLDEGSPDFADYVEAVGWAQDYARKNREAMLGLVIAAMRRHLRPFELTIEAVNCHHNYVEQEHHFGADVWVTRKGAIRAGKDQLGIIPGSMGARSYIVRGKGNPDSFESSAHGAGRRMSRNEANKRFTAADVARQTEG